LASKANKFCPSIRVIGLLDAMRAGVFGPLWREHDHLAGKVYLCPSELADLVPALAGQEKEAHHIAKGIVAQGTPQLPQFFRRKQPFP